MDLEKIALVAIGLFAACGGIFNWEWFMNHRKAQFVSNLLTRNVARIFYIIIGVVLIVYGVLATFRYV